MVGRGAFGKVYLVKKRHGEDAGAEYALKVLDKAGIKQKGQVGHTKSERAILREIRHPFLVRRPFSTLTIVNVSVLLGTALPFIL